MKALQVLSSKLTFLSIAAAMKGRICLTLGSMVIDVVGAVNLTSGSSVLPRYSLKARTRLASESRSGRLFMQSNLKYSLITLPSLSRYSSSSISMPNSKPRLSSQSNQSFSPMSQKKRSRSILRLGMLKIYIIWGCITRLSQTDQNASIKGEQQEMEERDKVNNDSLEILSEKSQHALFLLPNWKCSTCLSPIRYLKLQKPMSTNRTPPSTASLKTRSKQLLSILQCQHQVNHCNHVAILEAAKKRQANIKKELRLVILKNIENFYKKTYPTKIVQMRTAGSPSSRNNKH